MTGFVGGCGLLDTLQTMYQGGEIGAHLYGAGILTTVAAICDGLRHSIATRSAQATLSEKNPLVALLGGISYDELVTNVRDAYDLHGAPVSVTAQGTLAGTAVFKRGYHTKLTLCFEDGQVSLLHKYLDRAKQDAAKSITRRLHEKGHSFAPRLVSIHTPEHIKEGDDKNYGAFYEWVDMPDLESTLGEPTAVSINLPTVRTISRTMSKMENVNTLPWTHIVNYPEIKPAPRYSFHKE